ncbi:MAG: pitrilysin family protein [Bacteroidales bacterium]
MAYQFHELPNGIRIIYSPSHSRVAHLGVYINAGSRDEGPEEHGIAHFIEHMAFKGTTRRKSFHILNRLDTVGGDLNAFTTKEHTCLYASFLSEYTARAIELFSDIILNSTFPQKELSREKSIILDEINSYKDSPSESIFDDFEELIYPNHPIGRNILGAPESLELITRSQIMRFIYRNYSASETAIAYIGALPFKRVVLLLEKFFCGMNSNHLNRQRISVEGYNPVTLTVDKETHQTHVMLGTVAYPFTDPRKRTFQLINNMLGGPGSNSRLNLALRERRGYTYHVESNYQSYSDTGHFTIYMGTTSSDPKSTIKLAFKELDLLRKATLGTLQLHRAKKQLAGQIALAYESKVNEMLSIGRKHLYHLETAPIEQIIAGVEAITASEILEVANEILVPEKFSILIYQSQEDDE